jgi:hypothetical protein
MSLVSNKSIIRDGLILHWDCANKRCYKGAPITNMYGTFGSGAVNTYPSVGNNWGTYNTNHYNVDGSPFSIGTIASVSGNVVTTNAAHLLKSRDVLTPTTTGGGVTAGTHYFIKALSSTTFTLHAYTPSENGSVGFAALNDYNNDTRISVNSSGFPTNWVGTAHKANSGLVKTIVSNAFNGHSCIRIHQVRTDISSTQDHMAYGVSPLVTAGQKYTWSFWYRAGDAAAIGRQILFNVHYYNGSPQVGTLSTLTLAKNWQKCIVTHTAPTGSTHIDNYWQPAVAAVSSFSFDLTELQMENKDGVSFFTPTTRGATVALGGGLYDLSRNSNDGTISGNPVDSENNGGKLTLDGVDDYIYTPTIAHTTERTVEMVYRLTTTSGGIWGPLFRIGDWKERVFKDGLTLLASGGSTHTYTWTPTTNIMYLSYTYSATTAKIYINGSLVNTLTLTTPMDIGSSIYRFGHQMAGASEGYCPADIHEVRFYSRALSAAEIKQNFESSRKRYSL